MSDSMMSVEEARAWLDPSTGPKPAVPSPLLVDRYARTIVAQAEQNARLQAALRAADGLVLTFSGLPPRTDFESDYGLLPGDMEDPEVEA